MIRIAFCDIPETEEEALYQQLAYNGKFEKEITSLLSYCIDNYAGGDTLKLIEWIWEQEFFPVRYYRKRGPESITVTFVNTPTSRLQIMHEHQNWYYTLAGHCSEYAVRDLINER